MTLTLSAQPTATINDMITAANAAYQVPGDPALGSNWTPLNVAPANSPLADSMSIVGYLGQAYVNLQTGEVIIADRGTVPTNVQNLVLDVQLAAFHEQQAKQTTDAFAVAATQAA